MAEYKNTEFDRPGGYAMPRGATSVQREAAREIVEAKIHLFGDEAPPHSPQPLPRLEPAHQASDPDTRLYIGDCRDVLAALPDRGSVDLVFADPPFNWDVPYESWSDGMPRREYERFTFDWLDGCIDCLAPHGSIFVNIPDDTAAECVLHLKRRGLTMINWCVWHFRFGQNRSSSFIMSKVHVLYFAKLGRTPTNLTTEITESTEQADGEQRNGLQNPKSKIQNADSVSSVVNPLGRIWNPNEILELSDRASIYFDPRTMAKDDNKGMRVPMDVWYGKYWGRIQGNNKERRHNHHNQIPEVYLERVIKACSNPGSLVLDPFCGSGTTSTVARALGRRSITIEHSKVNADSAWERITKIGMIPREDAGRPQSSAIFGSRRRKQTSSADITSGA
jgi:site-specific DNA-methyltransferase (adenine-specific)